jgi:enoyl-CoA hydratase/carnithine racemase
MGLYAAEAVEFFQDLPRGPGCVRLVPCEDGIVEIVLDSPTRRNAMGVGMMLDLANIVQQIEAEPPLGILLRGEGSEAFCAGGDLVAVREHLLDPRGAAAMNLLMGHSLSVLRKVRAPILVFVQGVALGGGAELCMVADEIIAEKSAKIGFVQAALGVSPGWSGGEALVARVGPRAAWKILTEARALTVDECVGLGLVDQVVEVGEGRSAALARLLALSRLGPEALYAIRRICDGASPGEERDLFLSLWGSPAHQRALDSRRVPR